MIRPKIFNNNMNRFTSSSKSRRFLADFVGSLRDCCVCCWSSLFDSLCVLPMCRVFLVILGSALLRLRCQSVHRTSKQRCLSTEGRGLPELRSFFAFQSQRRLFEVETLLIPSLQMAKVLLGYFTTWIEKQIPEDIKEEIRKSNISDEQLQTHFDVLYNISVYIFRWERMKVPNLESTMDWEEPNVPPEMIKAAGRHCIFVLHSLRIYNIHSWFEW